MWSGQRDSNSRPTGPKPVALPGCAMPRKKYVVIYLANFKLHILVMNAIRLFGFRTQYAYCDAQYMKSNDTNIAPNS